MIGCVGIYYIQTAQHSGLKANLVEEKHRRFAPVLFFVFGEGSATLDEEECGPQMACTITN